MEGKPLVRVATASLDCLLRPEFKIPDREEERATIKNKLDTTQRTISNLKREIAFSVEKLIVI
ncbi:hypothetical protein BG000_007089, partial [Podila horticola]